jgi:hypothetical protein
MGAKAPVYVIGAAVALPVLALRTIAGGTIRAPPRSYFALLSLTAYVVLLDVARGEPPSPNSGNLILGAIAPLLVFSADASTPNYRAIRAGAWTALGILAIDRALQFLGYPAPSPLNDITDPSLSYYRYKASYVAGDSNSVGLFLFPLFAVLYATAQARRRAQSAFEYAMQVATLSKASIAALLVRDLVTKGLPRAVRATAVVALACGAAYVAMKVDLGRAFNSGLVKLHTGFMFADAMFASDPVSVVFGHGNNSALGMLGIYLHAWPMTAAYETGVIGLALVLWYLGESYRESRRVFMTVHLPIFCVAGWSYLFYLGSMWLYLPHYVLLALEAARARPAAATRAESRSDARCAAGGRAG